MAIVNWPTASTERMSRATHTRVFEALGYEAIVEHSQWLILRRARPLELHIVG